MALIGIFYGSTQGNVEHIAYEIQKIFGEEHADIFNIKNAENSDFKKYKYLIFGTSTCENGNIQQDWADKLNLLGNIDFTDKKIALFSLGDQKNYPNSFADGMGVLYDVLNDYDADIIGNWYAHGYIFNKSKAFVNGSFVGLVLDETFQPSVTQIRLQKWTDYLKTQFKEITD